MSTAYPVARSNANPTEQRAYHDRHGAYQLPADEEEHIRLESQSEGLFNLMNGQPLHAPRLFPPPARPPRRILDIGCGTGAMTELLARAYPDAEVVGLDLAPSARAAGRAPNITIVTGNVHDLVARAAAGVGGEEKDDDSDVRRFRPGSFDYVFQRLLVLGIKDWPAHVRTVTSLVAPGGWLEMHELSTLPMSAQNESAVSDTTWYTYPWMRADTLAVGLDIEIGPRLKSVFEETPGLTDVQDTMHRFAMRPDPVKRPHLVGIEASSLSVMKMLVWKVSSARRSKDELAEMDQDLKQTWAKDWEDGSGIDVHAVIARKKLS